jgi:fumarate hydratase subunit alpha
MKTILYATLVQKVKELCVQAAFDLPSDVSRAIKRSLKKETSPLAMSLLSRCIDNAHIAKKEHIPLCQDTGIAVFYAKIGNQVKIKGGTLTKAINEGVRIGYTESFLRPSMVDDP